MTLTHHGLGPLGCKALAFALVVNLNIHLLHNLKQRIVIADTLSVFSLICISTRWN